MVVRIVTSLARHERLVFQILHLLLNFKHICNFYFVLNELSRVFPDTFVIMLAMVVL